MRDVYLFFCSTQTAMSDFQRPRKSRRILPSTDVHGGLHPDSLSSILDPQPFLDVGPIPTTEPGTSGVVITWQLPVVSGVSGGLPPRPIQPRPPPCPVQPIPLPPLLQSAPPRPSSQRVLPPPQQHPFQVLSERQSARPSSVPSPILPIGCRPYSEPTACHNLGRMDIECPYCHALHWDAEKTSRSRIGRPSFGTCCDHGQVQLPPLRDPPPLLRDLLTGMDSMSKEFRKDIRQYNMAFAFTSLGVQQDDVNDHGGWVFRILGQLSHLAGSLLPSGGLAPQFAQLYILDPAVALRHRTDRNKNLSPTLMSSLQSMLTASHHYATVYKHAFEILPLDAPDYEIRLHVTSTTDHRRYNLPTGDEVAAILPGDGSATEARDIILRRRMPEGQGLYRIHDGHPAYAPLHYVLLFPHGDHGWHYGLRLHQPDKSSPARLTLTRYTAYRIHFREIEFPTILRGGRLFQQYIVDMWASADQDRLSYLRHNQGKLRAALYSGLEDALSHSDGTIELGELGTRYVLPSTYIGGARHMQQRFQDAMAIARYFKKVDLFITITANP
ncbi:hypothetical protein BDN72DRAFT_800757, partial [Pluteus cervinus]